MPRNASSQPEKAEGRETEKDSQGSCTLEACKAVKYSTKVGFEQEAANEQGLSFLTVKLK